MKEIKARVTTQASRNEVIKKDTVFHVKVTCVPEGGKANREVQKLLAKHLGVSKTSLVLKHGAKARDKIFEIED
jgi:hypothetical protein